MEGTPVGISVEWLSPNITSALLDFTTMNGGWKPPLTSPLGRTCRYRVEWAGGEMVPRHSKRSHAMRLSIQVLGALTIMCVVGVAAPLAQADSVELVNGDVINGKVVSLDDRELRLTSDIHGELTIRRATRWPRLGWGTVKSLGRPPPRIEQADGAEQSVERMLPTAKRRQA